MFLAFNELRHEKTRFALIIAIVALISFLTYFLTGLAYGLATSYTQGIDKWQAHSIAIQKDANSTITRSLLTEADYTLVDIPDTDKARLGVSGTTLQLDETEDVSLFGIDEDSFITPNITEGRAPQNASELIASTELQKSGLELNESIVFTGSDKQYTIVGFTNNATFQTQPIIYFELDEWRSITAELSGMGPMRDPTTFSAIVLKNQPADISADNLDVQTIRDFSFALPGYNAQVLTFGTMIGFLIFISSFVIAIFTYILTLQKKSIFGILKAEGVPTSYIAKSVQYQVFILTLIGTLTGLLFTLLLGWIMKDIIPFLVEPLFIVGVSTTFFLCAALGAIASVRVVTNIDPVEAIG